MIFLRTFFSLVSFPEFSSATWRVMRRKWVLFSYRPVSETLILILEPTFLLVALGFGLSLWISDIDNMSYSHYLFPGLIVQVATWVPFWESSFGVYARLQKPEVYWSWLQTPIEVNDLAAGELLWPSLKGLVASSILLTGGWMAGLIQGSLVWFAPLLLFPCCVFFSGFGLLVGSRAGNATTILLIQAGVMVPLTLFSNTFFPADRLNWLPDFFWFISPVAYTVSGMRDIASGHLTSQFYFSLAFIWFAASVLGNLAQRSFIEKLLPK